MKVVWGVLVVCLHLMAMHITSFDTEVANGKTALITFGSSEGVVYKNVVFQKRTYPIVSLDNQRYFALIPVDYDAKPHTQEVVIKYDEHGTPQSTSFYLDVIKGMYASEEIHVDSKKVNPKSKKVQARIAKEYKEAMEVYHHITPRLYINKAFILPLHSKITSDFGKERLYNGSHRGYHSGTDFRAKMGTPVRASNDGVVVLVKNRFYSGGTVIIDHGEGIYTCYFHLSKFLVKNGQKVKRGEVIARSGKSGRVTGPHLHFAVRVYGVQVDPMQFITLMNQKILQGS